MCLVCLHPGQARKNLGEVFTNINFQAAAVLHKGVEDGAFAPGLAGSNEPKHAPFLKSMTSSSVLATGSNSQVMTFYGEAKSGA